MELFMLLRKQLTYFIILTIIIFNSFSSSFAQDNQHDSFWDYTKKTIAHDSKHIFKLGVSIIQAPSNFNKQDLYFALYSGVSTSTLFFIDPSTKNISLRNHNELNDKIFSIDDYLNGGKGKFAGLGIYLTGFIFKEEKIRITGLYALESVFLASSITGILKYSFGRRRPYAGIDHMNFESFRGKIGKYRSFPSGHTTGAFAFASVMAMSLDNTYWKIGWYGSAAMVGFARIYHNVHWLSDTFLAGVISYSVANYVVNYESRQMETHSPLNFSLYPGPNGITLSVQF